MHTDASPNSTTAGVVSFAAARAAMPQRSTGSSPIHPPSPGSFDAAMTVPTAPAEVPISTMRASGVGGKPNAPRSSLADHVEHGVTAAPIVDDIGQVRRDRDDPGLREILTEIPVARAIPRKTMRKHRDACAFGIVRAIDIDLDLRTGELGRIGGDRERTRLRADDGGEEDPGDDRELSE